MPKPQSEPSSPSVSRSSTPPPLDSLNLDDDEPDSEEEREELSRVETQSAGSSSGRQTPTRP